MNVFTIGFTEKPAKRFFELVRGSGAKRVVDVRLNNTGQLAGFSKRDDLKYFLKEICAIGYEHETSLAPTQVLLDSYKKAKGDWSTYERDFLELMRQRRIEDIVPRAVLDGACLLCSEASARHCHRRLVVEYLQSAWGDLQVKHL